MKDFVRYLTFLSFLGVFVSSARTSKDPGDVQGSDNIESLLLRRLEENERLVQQLLGRVDYLEEREKTQASEINNLRENLVQQTRRTNSLERLVRHLTTRTSSVMKQVESVVTDVRKIEESNTATRRNDGSVGGKETQRIRRAENENPIAFFATITGHVNHAGVNQTFVFDNVVTNLGNAYNKHNGNFIAPVRGAYVFSVTLMSLYHNNGHSRFFKNGQPIGYMYVSGSEGGYDTTSQTIVLQLEKGDDVCVHNLDADVSMAGNHYSSFTGFLLQEDVSNPAVVVGK